MNKDRNNIAYGIIAFVVLSVSLSAGLGEMRVQMLIDYPWLHDRDNVLKTLDEIEKRLEHLEILSHPDPEKRVSHWRNMPCLFEDYAVRLSLRKPRQSDGERYSTMPDATRMRTVRELGQIVAVGKSPQASLWPSWH